MSELLLPLTLLACLLALLVGLVRFALRRWARPSAWQLKQGRHRDFRRRRP